MMVCEPVLAHGYIVLCLQGCGVCPGKGSERSSLQIKVERNTFWYSCCFFLPYCTSAAPRLLQNVLESSSKLLFFGGAAQQFAIM